MKVPFESGSITLEDICYKPLAPEIQKCTIQSVFQYFQDNRTSLNKCLTSTKQICNNYTLHMDFKAWDFHDHILSCTRYRIVMIIIIVIIIIVVIQCSLQKLNRVKHVSTSFHKASLILRSLYASVIVYMYSIKNGSLTCNHGNPNYLRQYLVVHV